MNKMKTLFTAISIGAVVSFSPISVNDVDARYTATTTAARTATTTSVRTATTRATTKSFSTNKLSTGTAYRNTSPSNLIGANTSMLIASMAFLSMSFNDYYEEHDHYPSSLNEIDLPKDQDFNKNEWHIESGLLIKSDLREEDIEEYDQDFRDDYVKEMVRDWYQIEIPLKDVKKVKQIQQDQKTMNLMITVFVAVMFSFIFFLGIMVALWNLTLNQK